MTMIRTTFAALVLVVACGVPSDEGVVTSASGFTYSTRSGAGPCGSLSHQWELTSYDARATAATPTGFALAGDLDAAAGADVDAVADQVDACLDALDGAEADAQCWPRDRWQLQRACTTVLAVPGEPSCTMPGLWLLPDDAGGSCDTWNKPASPCACRWSVATQDAGRTVVVPAQDPTARLAEGLVRVASGCLYPWLDPGIAACSGITL